MLVGHSVGAAIVLGVLAERSPATALGGIFLVAAPFVGDGGWPSEDVHLTSELGERLPRGVPVHFFQGLADDTVPAEHVELYARAVPQARVHRLPGRDHQLNDDLSEVARAIVTLDGGGLGR
jgi:predicted alpha/beta hydrolase family esterase